MVTFTGVQSTLRSASFGGVSRIMLALAVLPAAQAWAGAASDSRLDEVFVTATQREQAVRDVPAAAAVVKRDEIEAAGADNVLAAVRETTGIGLVGQSVAGRKTMSLRGMDGKHTLYLVNGLRVINTDDWVGHSDFQYDWTPVDSIERIEVVRGPMSVLYGSDALGGVINTITRRPDAEWRGGVRLGGRSVAGGGDSLSGGVHFSGGLTDTLRMAISATRLQRSPLERKEDRRTSEIEGTDLQSGHLLLSWQPLAAHTFDLEHRVSNEERERDQVRSGTYYRDTYDIDRSQSIATWRADWSGVETQLRAWESDFSVSNRRTNGVAPTRPQSMDDRGVDGRVGFALGSMQYLTVGFDTRTETMKNAGLAGGKDDADFRALYIQDEIALAADLTLTLGFRRDRHSIFGAESSPRAYLVWHATDAWTLRGGYGEGFRAPTLKQASSSYEGAEGPHTFYGNGDIRPETSKSWELGLMYAKGAIDWELTAFRNSVTDLITTREIRRVGPRAFYIYDNINDARIQGVETALRVDLGGGFDARLSGQWLDTEDKTSGKPLNARPDHLLNARLGWKQGPLSAALRLEHTGRQYVTSAARKAPAYNLLHLQGGYAFNKHLRVTAGIDNITNVRLADKSSLFSYSETPRALRVTLHGAF